MPEFSWYGVDISGSVRKGRMYAKDQAALDGQLFKREIALLQAKKRFSFSYFSQSLSIDVRKELCEQLSFLLSSGVLLPDALTLIADQMKRMHIRDYIHRVADDVRNGSRLSTIFSRPIYQWDYVARALITSGEESGNMAQVFTMLAHYYEYMITTRSLIMRSLISPFITFFFFIVVAIGIVMVVIPRFAQLFVTLSKPIPVSIERLLTLRSYLVSGYAVLFVICGSSLLYLLIKGVHKRYAILDIVPYISSMRSSYTAYSICTSLSLLLKGGMSFVVALETVASCYQQESLVKMLTSIKRSIVDGMAVSIAFEQYPRYFTPQAIALINVGQETGLLGAMFERLSSQYKVEFERYLSMITYSIQPLMLLILGGMIAWLIITLYSPLLTLANVI